MDEADDIIEQEAGTPIGEQLREAREAKGLSVEELARSSRIPQRHLENLEVGNWDKLPAATYTIGFAKTYAEAVDLDREAVADHVRAEMGARPAPVQHSGVYEVADSSSGMPRWVLVVAAVAVVGAILLFSWMNDQRLAADEEVSDTFAQEEPEVPAPAAPEEPAVTDDTPVTLVASRAVWLRVTDGGETLFSRELAAGEEFLVPASAEAPMLETARPASLSARIGDRDYGFEGEDGTRVSDVSLLAPAIVETAGEGTAATGERAVDERTTTSAATPATSPRRAPSLPPRALPAAPTDPTAPAEEPPPPPSENDPVAGD